MEVTKNSYRATGSMHGSDSMLHAYYVIVVLKARVSGMFWLSKEMVVTTIDSMS